MVCLYDTTRCEVGGKCYPPEYGTCVKSNGSSSCGPSSPTPKPSPTDFPYGAFVISSVKGQKSTYKPNEKISLSFDVAEEFDGSAAEPEEGFHSQVYIEVPKTGSWISYVDAIWTGSNWEAALKAPSEGGNYRIWIAAWCANPDSLCIQRYGEDAQADWKYPFQISVGNVPGFIPLALGRGRLNKNYAANIRGYDFDRKDLTAKSMSISGGSLPAGLTFGNCTVSNVILSSIICRVRGNPRETGTFYFTLTLTDKAGNTTNRAMRLTVTK